MKTDPLRIFKREQWPDELFNNWLPNINDLNIIRERIEKKSVLNLTDTDGMANSNFKIPAK